MDANYNPEDEGQVIKRITTQAFIAEYKLSVQYDKYPFIYEVSVKKNGFPIMRLRELAMEKIKDDIVVYNGYYVRPYLIGDGLWQRYYRCKVESCSWKAIVQIIASVDEYDPTCIGLTFQDAVFAVFFAMKGDHSDFDHCISTLQPIAENIPNRTKNHKMDRYNQIGGDCKKTASVYHADPNQNQAPQFKPHKWGKGIIPDIRIMCKGLFSSDEILVPEVAAKKMVDQLKKVKKSNSRSGQLLYQELFMKFFKHMYRARQSVGYFMNHSTFEMKATDKLTILMSNFNPALQIEEKKMYLTIQQWHITLAKQNIQEYVNTFLDIIDKVQEKDLTRWCHSSLALQNGQALGYRKRIQKSEQVNSVKLNSVKLPREIKPTPDDAMHESNLKAISNLIEQDQTLFDGDYEFVNGTVIEMMDEQQGENRSIQAQFKEKEEQLALAQKEFDYAKAESQSSKRVLYRIYSFAYDWKKINNTIIPAMEARNKDKMGKYKKFVLKAYDDDLILDRNNLYNQLNQAQVDQFIAYEDGVDSKVTEVPEVDEPIQEKLLEKKPREISQKKQNMNMLKTIPAQYRQSYRDYLDNEQMEKDVKKSDRLNQSIQKLNNKPVLNSLQADDINEEDLTNQNESASKSKKQDSYYSNEEEDPDLAPQRYYGATHDAWNFSGPKHGLQSLVSKK